MIENKKEGRTMKNHLLMLSCALLIVAKTDASQKNEHGGVIAEHPPKLHPLHDATHSLRSESKNWSRELTTNSTDPYELAEKSDELFSVGHFKEAAKLFISSAIHGNYDNKACLVRIDRLSLRYLDLTHQTQEAELYYKNTLTPKLVTYLETEFAELKKHKDKPVKVYSPY